MKSIDLIRSLLLTDFFWFSKVREQEVAVRSTIFFPRIDDSHCDRIYSSLSLSLSLCLSLLSIVSTWLCEKAASAEYRFKERQRSMDRCTGRRNITLKTALNTIQLVNLTGLTVNLTGLTVNLTGLTALVFQSVGCKDPQPGIFFLKYAAFSWVRIHSVFILKSGQRLEKNTVQGSGNRNFWKASRVGLAAEI